MSSERLIQKILCYPLFIIDVAVDEGINPLLHQIHANPGKQKLTKPNKTCPQMAFQYLT
jgi:hypothetical protein